MGIHLDLLPWITGLHLPAGFSVVELGDQRIEGSQDVLADVWYRVQGCGRYESIDGNGRGTLTYDLNLPVPLLVTFDLVTDFGCGEHVFDQAQVFRTMHDLCRVGGYILFDRPIEGYPGHGYYCADPCLLDEIAAANRYTVLRRKTRKTNRGHLMRALWQRTTDEPFTVPQQGRYTSILTI